MEAPQRPRLLLVVGTRPEVVKMAPVVRAADRHGVPFLLVHSGQHYDDALDGVFFRELGLPAPSVQLGVGSCERPEQVERVRGGVREVARRERPDVIVVQGDTNSALGGARAADDLGISLAHVEAGLRCGDLAMPEEQNRREADRLASLRFAPTPEAQVALLTEGCAPESVFVTGNTVVDELERQLPRARARGAAARLGLRPGAFGLATIHRQEAVHDGPVLREVLAGVARGMDAWQLPVVLPAHPRTARRIRELRIDLSGGLRLMPPLGYLDFLSLLADAAVVWTDSGGVQEEACCLGVPSVVLRDSTERPEAVEAGASRLAGRVATSIEAASAAAREAPLGWPNPFGDGKAGERILATLLRWSER